MVPSLAWGAVQTLAPDNSLRFPSSSGLT